MGMLFLSQTWIVTSLLLGRGKHDPSSRYLCWLIPKRPFDCTRVPYYVINVVTTPVPWPYKGGVTVPPISLQVELFHATCFFGAHLRMVKVCLKIGRALDFQKMVSENLPRFASYGDPGVHPIKLTAPGRHGSSFDRGALFWNFWCKSLARFPKWNECFTELAAGNNFKRVKCHFPSILFQRLC